MTRLQRIEAYKELARQLQAGLANTICSSANRWILYNLPKSNIDSRDTMESLRDKVFPEIRTMGPTHRIVTGGEKVKRSLDDKGVWFPIQQDYIKERIKWLNKVIKKISQIEE